jgi:hypothetical protein
MSLSIAFASAKATLELITAGAKALGDAKVQQATIDLREQLFSVSDIAMSYIERNAALVQENAALKLAKAQLESEHAEIERKLGDMEGYVLHQFRPGVFVYARGPGVDGLRQPPYRCAACWNADKQISVLQRSGPVRLSCPADAMHALSVSVRPSAQPVR